MATPGNSAKAVPSPLVARHDAACRQIEEAVEGYLPSCTTLEDMVPKLFETFKNVMSLVNNVWQEAESEPTFEQFAASQTLHTTDVVAGGFGTKLEAMQMARTLGRLLEEALHCRCQIKPSRLKKLEGEVRLRFVGTKVDTTAALHLSNAITISLFGCGKHYTPQSTSSSAAISKHLQSLWNLIGQSTYLAINRVDPASAKGKRAKEVIADREAARVAILEFRDEMFLVRASSSDGKLRRIAGAGIETEGPGKKPKPLIDGETRRVWELLGKGIEYSAVSATALALLRSKTSGIDTTPGLKTVAVVTGASTADVDQDPDPPLNTGPLDTAPLDTAPLDISSIVDSPFRYHDGSNIRWNPKTQIFYNSHDEPFFHFNPPSASIRDKYAAPSNVDRKPWIIGDNLDLGDHIITENIHAVDFGGKIRFSVYVSEKDGDAVKEQLKSRFIFQVPGMIGSFLAELEVFFEHATIGFKDIYCVTKEFINFLLVSKSVKKFLMRPDAECTFNMGADTARGAMADFNRVEAYIVAFLIENNIENPTRSRLPLCIVGLDPNTNLHSKFTAKKAQSIPGLYSSFSSSNGGMSGCATKQRVDGTNIGGSIEVGVAYGLPAGSFQLDDLLDAMQTREDTLYRDGKVLENVASSLTDIYQVDALEQLQRDQFKSKKAAIRDSVVAEDDRSRVAPPPSLASRRGLAATSDVVKDLRRNTTSKPKKPKKHFWNTISSSGNGDGYPVCSTCGQVGKSCKIRLRKRGALPKALWGVVDHPADADYSKGCIDLPVRDTHAAFVDNLEDAKTLSETFKSVVVVHEGTPLLGLFVHFYAHLERDVEGLDNINAKFCDHILNPQFSQLFTDNPQAQAFLAIMNPSSSTAASKTTLGRYYVEKFGTDVYLPRGNSTRPSKLLCGKLDLVFKHTLALKRNRDKAGVSTTRDGGMDVKGAGDDDDDMDVDDDGDAAAMGAEVDDGAVDVGIARGESTSDGGESTSDEEDESVRLANEAQDEDEEGDEDEEQEWEPSA